MSKPFEVPNTDYTVLRNDENQHSLWPAFADVPAGWTVVHGPDRREACMTYVRENWVDLRPRSVAEFVAEHAGDR
jgi:MbtH protein